MTRPRLTIAELEYNRIMRGRDLRALQRRRQIDATLSRAELERKREEAEAADPQLKIARLEEQLERETKRAEAGFGANHQTARKLQRVAQRLFELENAMREAGLDPDAVSTLNQGTLERW